MATNTTNFGFKKPDESDFYSIADQNNNWDRVDEELQNLDTPAFEDYTGDTSVPAAATALAGIKSKGKLATILSNIKAFAKGCCTLAMIVDNCTTDRADLPGSAAQLKVLMDLYTKLNSDKVGLSSTSTGNLCHLQKDNIRQTVRLYTNETDFISFFYQYGKLYVGVADNGESHETVLISF